MSRKCVFLSHLQFGMFFLTMYLFLSVIPEDRYPEWLIVALAGLIAVIWDHFHFSPRDRYRRSKTEAA